MIQIETTWHPQVAKRTTFSWDVTEAGVAINHNQGNGEYTIPWNIFITIVRQAKAMAIANNGIITAGVHQTNPTQGSIGEWVLTQNFRIPTGKLTPRHLSFIGPILGRMGTIDRETQGLSIIWRFI